MGHLGGSAAVNATVDVGYRSSVAADRSNLAYWREALVTFEEAKAADPNVLWMHSKHDHA